MTGPVSPKRARTSSNELVASPSFIDTFSTIDLTIQMPVPITAIARTLTTPRTARRIVFCFLVIA